MHCPHAFNKTEQEAVMHKQGIVIDTKYNTEKNLVLAQLLTFAECVNCNKPCRRRGKTVPVKNPKNFELKENQGVIIATPKHHEYKLAIFSLLLPVLLCFGGWYFTNNPVVIGICLATGLAVVFAASRAKKLISYPEITDVLGQEC